MERGKGERDEGAIAMESVLKRWAQGSSPNKVECLHFADVFLPLIVLFWGSV